MGFFSNVWQTLKRPVQLFTSTGRGQQAVAAYFSSRAGDPPRRGTRDFLEAYQASPFVQAAAGKVGRSVGETQWLLEGLRGELLTDHLMLRTLQRPNLLMTGMDLFCLAQVQLDMAGEVFLLVERNGLGAPVGLYPLPAHWIAETPTPREPSYRLSWYSLNERVPMTEIWWAKLLAPVDPYGRGAGIAQALSDEIATFEYASKHAEGLFFNRAMPDVVVMDEGAGPEELKRHEQHWLQRLQGFWRAFKPYFVSRKLEFWQPQQMNLENLTLVPLQKFERDVILQTWGIPPEQLGIVESSNRATAEASDYIYEKRVVRPRREWWRAQMQAFLAPQYDGRLKVRYVDTVPADKDYNLNVAKAAPHARTVNEWRELQGLAPLDGPAGMAHLVPLNSFITGDLLDQAQRPQAAPGGRPASSPEAGEES